MPDNINDKPLTVGHIYEILIPEMERVFVTKREFTEFKDLIMTSHDKILKSLDTLTTEKVMRDHQKKKERKLWLIMIEALQEHKILSPKQMQEIKALEVF